MSGTKRKADSDASPSTQRNQSQGNAKASSKSSGTASAAGNNKPADGQPSKRTLQNRKAQREFRKRREARVRELEERCRRYDQLGLEANTELQRVARRLKEENEALRGLLIRLGFGNMIPSVLESLGSDGFLPGYEVGPVSVGPFASDAPQQSTTGDYGTINANINMGMAPIGPAVPSQLPSAQAQPNTHSTMIGGVKVTMPASAPANQPNFTIPDGSVNPSMLQPNSVAPGGISEPLDYWAALQRKMQQHILQQQQQAQRQQPGGRTPVKSSKTVPSSSSPSKGEARPNGSQQPSASMERSETPLLSLNLGADGMVKTGSTQESKGPSGFSNPTLSRALSRPNIGGAFGGAQGGAGMAGSSLLGRNPNSTSTPSNLLFPIPQRTHQNDALLNPNPIPFAFNLSNPSQPPETSWWDSMSGSMLSPRGDNDVLDEKAQAVAAAQQSASAANNGAQSPFDLTAFLVGGLTPGGSLNTAVQGSNSEPSSAANKKLGSPSAVAPPLPNTEHAQMFLRLLEQKLANRDPMAPYSSLGFQPPQQLQQMHQDYQSSSIDAISVRHMPGPEVDGKAIDGGLTPSGVYSRLAQHPAFLSTNAKELEELVDVMGARASRSPSSASSSGGNGNGQGHSPSNSHASASISAGRDESASAAFVSGKGNASLKKASPPTFYFASSNSSDDRKDANSGVGVDEGTVNHILDILDRKGQGGQEGAQQKQRQHHSQLVSA